jgi:hypothetical protein
MQDIFVSKLIEGYLYSKPSNITCAHESDICSWRHCKIWSLQNIKIYNFTNSCMKILSFIGNCASDATYIFL